MRELVQKVRALSQPDDTVLLLPNDPNVEAWFERKLPELSSAIAFTDQYWDRFVDADVDRLLSRPPKVIVVGPRNFWREFTWHKQRRPATWGLERLVDTVEARLLERRYRLAEQQPITFGAAAFLRGRLQDRVDDVDYMDVYVRSEPAAAPALP